MNSILKEIKTPYNKRYSACPAGHAPYPNRWQTLLGMKNIYFLICILTIIGIFISCNSKKPDYYGQWEIWGNNKFQSLIDISKDKVKLYRRIENSCYSTFSNPDILNITDLTRDNHSLRINSLSNNYSLEIELTVSNATEGEICFIEGIEKECLQLRKTDINMDSILHVKRSEIYKYKDLIADKIYSVQNEFGLLTKDEPLDPETNKILNYIDSLCITLLDQYDLDFSSIKCWNKVDSILNRQIATNFLVGFDTGFINWDYNAYELEKRLRKYLTDKKSEKIVGTIFPTFIGGDFIEQRKDGIPIGWITNKFYQVPLGEVIIQLIDLKVKIVQIQKISKTTTK